MNEATVLFFIIIIFSILVIYWVSITVSIIYRRRRTASLTQIELTFADIVSRYLYNDPKNPLTLPEITQTLRDVGIKEQNKNNIQYLIRLMIRTQRTILGSNFYKLQKLYAQIPPHGVSIKKISSWSWYRKARGIREIYEMNQSQYFDEIFKYRNDKNIYVRREAQIALVVFLGWESLRFLPYLKRNMTLWQQIKIVEKLYDHYPKPELKWLHRAYKTEKLFGKKLLMRIIRKYELHAETDFIINNLNHPDYEVRETAIYCIQTFAVSTPTMDYIKRLYDEIPNATQQGQLLNYIYENSDIDLDFYLKQLYGTNDDLKLSVAEILWNNGYKEKVQEFYYQQYPNAVLNVG
ncbi:HEAT repeat domain-containing protein [Christiangramia echinicola]|uniref:HEAT repeat domain-containing protein n=1 Tax=Christiangramia echinicola TaxID=279359 RepID=UPI0004252EC4|nr:HEAT repeat domain-containing protein [Christiangramia echinicola]